MDAIDFSAFKIQKQQDSSDAQSVISHKSLVKKGIWLYFLLIIFEGALRKWFVPSLAGPLLIVRDPLVLWIIGTAWRRGLITLNYYSVTMIVIGVIGIYTAFFIGHGSLAVALYGARILLLHFPLIFIIGQLFTKEDVIKIGIATLILSIPMGVLITLQFYSPQSAWVNRGLGGEGSAGFDGALNYFRPPGTFSFTNGTTLFFDFVACFVFYFWFNTKAINRLVLIGATVALLIAIPFSISRGLFFQVGVTTLFAFLGIAFNPKYAFKMIFIVVGTIFVLVLLSFTHYFHNAVEAFTVRFETANKSEGGVNGVLLDRFLGGMVGALSDSNKQPFFGYGIGMGTNVGSTILSGGRFFLISEGEWGRLIGELGPVMGLAVILIRLTLAIKIFIASFKSMIGSDLMPWLLLSFGLLLLAQGGWAQPTSLGFCTLITGLIIASSKKAPAEN
jgi:hypothetical protein